MGSIHIWLFLSLYHVVEVSELKCLLFGGEMFAAKIATYNTLERIQLQIEKISDSSYSHVIETKKMLSLRYLTLHNWWTSDCHPLHKEQEGFGITWRPGNILTVVYQHEPRLLYILFNPYLSTRRSLKLSLYAEHFENSWTPSSRRGCLHQSVVKILDLKVNWAGLKFSK